jgi:predicted transcriptional regulator
MEEVRKYRDLRAADEADKPAVLARRKAHQALLESLLRELKTARESAGLSLADVRARTGMDRSAIAKLENGARANPTIDTLIRYAEAVGKRLVVSLSD